jgi:hypothetical protein
MYHAPFLNKRQSSPRQLAFENRQRLYVDGRFELPVPGMEMGRRMIVENIRMRMP